MFISPFSLFFFTLQTTHNTLQSKELFNFFKRVTRVARKTMNLTSGLIVTEAQKPPLKYAYQPIH